MQITDWSLAYRQEHQKFPLDIWHFVVETVRISGSFSLFRTVDEPQEQFQQAHKVGRHYATDLEIYPKLPVWLGSVYTARERGFHRERCFRTFGEAARDFYYVLNYLKCSPEEPFRLAMAEHNFDEML